MNILITLLKSLLRKLLPQEIRFILDWFQRGFGGNSIKFIKRAVLKRLGTPGATWVETGTYHGETTRFLSKFSSMVYSIEPERKLYSQAKENLKDLLNVEILNGTSEEVLPNLLPKIHGDINFWLDGHYSAGVTFKGKQDTPIKDELDCIVKHRSQFKKITILIDDIRCFNPKIEEYSTYPTLDYLVDWARANQFSWHIEHDIFVAKNY